VNDISSYARSDYDVNGRRVMMLPLMMLLMLMTSMVASLRHRQNNATA